MQQHRNKVKNLKNLTFFMVMVSGLGLRIINKIVNLSIGKQVYRIL
jgi:hypothetical protein